MKIKRFIFFIGTVAEFIKVFPVIKTFKENEVSFKLIFSGQNDIEKSEIFSYLNLDKPDLKISNGPRSKTTTSMFVWFVKTIFSSLFKVRKYVLNTESDSVTDSYMIVHGDTLSTLMGAYIAKILGMKVIHIEAGLRSFNLLHPFPEEICRVLVSFISDIDFCPNQWAMDNIKNKKSTKINTLNNTLLESLELASRTETPDSLKPLLENKPYFILVIHRQENLYIQSRLNNFLDDAINLSKSIHCVFILHAPAKIVLQKHGLLKRLTEIDEITVLSRQGYFDFMKLIDSSEFIITDGGSNQEESYYFGKPCLVLRNHTERIEGLNSNVVLWNNNQNSIKNFGNEYSKYKKNPVKYDVPPSKIIFESLTNA